MADARIIEVIDAMVSRVNAAWTGKGTGDEVSRVYLAPLNLASLTGRKVWFFPVRYSDGTADRGENETTYNVAAIIAERYTGNESEPPKSWVDTRVAFAEQQVYTQCDFGDSVGFLVPGAGRQVWTEAIDATAAYDVEFLSKKQVFWCEFEFSLREIAA